MYTPLNNYAFIDGNNLRLTYINLKIEFKYDKFISYLNKKHNVTKVYYFIGQIPKCQSTYDTLESFGYTMSHRDISVQQGKILTCPKCKHQYQENAKVKCDCDADIVLRIMNEINDYDKAILVSSDGDFDNTVKQLLIADKLDMVLACCKKGCSDLLVRAARGRIAFLDELLSEIEKY